VIERILLATGNAGKAAELARLLGCPVEPIAGWDPPVEDGDTFLANARIKALAGAAQAAQARLDARVCAHVHGRACVSVCGR
jgi:inosine/xanthosine triphosphate pyrophosphatase family protein